MGNLLVQVIFYVFAALALFSAIMVITQNNPVRCVLFLVLTFFASSVLWILLEAEFLALILVLVYVGAVMTLFLFVVMMLNIDTESLKSHFARYLPFGMILVALLVGLLLIVLPDTWYTQAVAPFVPAAQPIDLHNIADVSALAKRLSNTEQIGMVLYTDYVLAFELAAVLLLVAIISAITLAHRGIIRSKRQDIKKQIMTRPEDRVRLVSLKSEK
ncbi:NADH-quinone oxidoreductase subunit J [Legionella sp. CNM-1927-20]|uniref:NADH-quinone oxidoreductase subunit J n=1 Tax=Legionella sp. CNM-1927-20 TaxID=3422221 RepID=UPI00403B19C3